MLLSELRALEPRVNLMVTSRILDTIACEFAGQKKIEINAHVEDLRTYLRGRIYREDRLYEQVQRDPALGEQVIENVARKAHQMYVTLIGKNLSLIILASDSDLVS
jgi:hypothetical protein